MNCFLATKRQFINGVLGTVYKQMKAESGEEEAQEEVTEEKEDEQDNG